MRSVLASRFGERTWFVAVALAGVMTGFALAKCCGPPSAAQPSAENPLARQIAQALDGHEESAGRYAAFYELLADQFETQQYDTTNRAAQVAGRAAEILELPGHLEQIVGDELNPHLGTPGTLSPEQSQAAAKTLRDLAAACQEVAR